MRLYTRTGATAVGEHAVESDGSIEVPDELGEQLHRTHFNGKQAWEDDGERAARLVREDLERRRDPAQLYDLLASESKPAVTDAADVQAQIAAAVEQALAEERASVAKATHKPRTAAKS